MISLDLIEETIVTMQSVDQCDNSQFHGLSETYPAISIISKTNVQFWYNWQPMKGDFTAHV